MISLLLAIASSAMVSIIMRISEDRVRSKMAFFLANYLVCTLLGAFFSFRSGIAGIPEGFGFALGLGAFSGFLFLYSFVLFRQNVAKNGMVMSATFMKLGVLIPTLTAILIFREQPRLTQILGVVLAVSAIILLNYRKGAAGQANGKALLILLLIVSGFTDSTANVFDKLGNPAAKEFFLVFIFLTAFFCSAVLAIVRKETPALPDFLFGAAIGIPNYFSSRFLLGALQSVPAVITYPVYSVGTIVVITTVGVLAFREELDRRKLISLGLIFGALTLLNL